MAPEAPVPETAIPQMNPLREEFLTFQAAVTTFEEENPDRRTRELNAVQRAKAASKGIAALKARLTGRPSQSRATRESTTTTYTLPGTKETTIEVKFEANQYGERARLTVKTAPEVTEEATEEKIRPTLSRVAEWIISGETGTVNMSENYYDDPDGSDNDAIAATSNTRLTVTVADELLNTYVPASQS